MNGLCRDLSAFIGALPVLMQYLLNGIAGVVLYLMAEHAGATIGKAVYLISQT